MTRTLRTFPLLSTISVQLFLYVLGHCIAGKETFSQVIILFQTDTRCPPGVPYISLFSFTRSLCEPSRACSWEASPYHDAAFPMLSAWAAVFLEMCNFCCPPNIASSLLGRQLNVFLLNQRTSFHLILESPTCIWGYSSQEFI